jgi:CubicO group peptidase (beta-lactamase class C family)
MGLGEPTKLSPKMAALLRDRKSAGTPSMDIALGWHVFKRDGDEIVWHNGGTGGYRTFVGFDPKRKVGTVVLSNAGTQAGVDDIGRHIVDQRYPLAPAPKQRTEISVATDVLDRYVGNYALAPTAVLAVTREGSQLFVQLTGQPKLSVYAESETKFFLKVVDAQITFEPPDVLVLHQGGRDQRAKRKAE